MRLYDVDLELRALFSILNGNERVKQEFLAKVGDSHFGYPISKEILDKTLRIIKRRRSRIFDPTDNSLPIPSSKALSGAPGISEEAKIILAKPRDPISTKADVEEVLRNLEFYRKIRVVGKECKGIVKGMSGSVERVNMDSIREHLNRAVEGIQDFDVGRSITILRGKDGRNLAKQALKGSKLIRTGFKNYDSRGGGMKRTDLVIVAAPTGQGKSIMLLTEAVYLYLYENMSVCIPSFELSKVLCTERLISHVSGVPFKKIREQSISKKDHTLIRKLYDEFMHHGVKHNCQFAIMEPGHISADELGMILRPYGFDAVFPDHLNHLYHPEGKEEHSQLGSTARAMKSQAEANNQIWFTATQLDDESQKIRYSKMIKEEADTGWAWVSEEGSDIVKVKHLKCRHHEPFDFYLQKDFGVMTFRDSAGSPTLSEDGDHAFIQQMDELP